MFVKRSEKRKETVSSEGDDNEESYARIQFQVEFETKPNETLYMLGNIEELGNWEEDKAVKLLKLDSESSLWESMIPLECHVGMTIRYKYLTIDSNNKKNIEKLPNNEERAITTKKPGQYIIMNKQGDLITKISYVGKDKRNFKRKLSRINYDVLNNNKLSLSNGNYNGDDENININSIKALKFNFGNCQKTENDSEYVSYLSPKDLISYENNHSNFDIYDKIPDFDFTQKITSSDRCIHASMYLPFILKKTENAKNKYEIIEEENSLLLRYINNIKKTKAMNIIWVGMLKNYWDFNEDELDEIQEFLSEEDYYIIRPKKKDWQLFIYYIEGIISPVFFNSSFSPDEESFADTKKYFDGFYNINKNFYEVISVNYQNNDFIVLHNLALSLVPNLIMNKKYNSHIGIYIHTTLPSSDILKVFPNYQEIFKSILLCDVVGFHDLTTARNFCGLVERFLGIFSDLTKKGIISLSYLGRNIIIHIKQPQLDFDLVNKLKNYEEFKEYDKIYKEKYGKNDLTVISFDYLYIINAIFIKLKAIDLFLNSHRQLIGKCTFVMWIREFKKEIDEEENEEEEKEEEEEEDDEEEEEDDEDNENSKNKKIKRDKKINSKKDLSLIEANEKDKQKMQFIKEKIEQEIKNLKQKYHNDNIISVEYSSDEKTYNIFRRLAMFKHSNIFLYPFFLDGQGIFIKEFIAMKSEESKNYGAIVNESMAFMGIRSIIKVNPFDSDTIAKALGQINSWSFNKIRFECDIQSIKKNSAEKWIKGYLLDMKRVMLNDSDNKCKIGLGRDIAIMKLNEHFRQLRKTKLLKYFKNSRSRLLIFNYENTLQDIEEDIDCNLENILENKTKRKNYTKRIIKIISAFCQDPKNMVFIISKHNYEILNKIFGKIKNLGICGENGFFYKYPNEDEFKPLIKDIDWSWRETVLKIMKSFSEKTEGSKIIENKSNISWSYQNSDNFFGYVQADELKMHLTTILNTPTLDVSTFSNGILEVKPKNVNKGAFLAKILQDTFEKKQYDLFFIVGYDDTDEEMFKYLQSAKKYFHNFVNKYKIVTATINKHTSLANYYFNEINECIENLELLSKQKYKETEENEEEPRKKIFHFKEDEEDD